MRSSGEIPQFSKKIFDIWKIKINQWSFFRRADPSGQTIGEYVRKELSDKVGGADVFVGLPDSGTFCGTGNGQ